MQKRFITLLALLCATSLASAQTVVAPSIQKVTVYPNGALVEKTATVHLQKGENKFIFPGNSSYASADLVHFDVAPHWYVASLKVNAQKYSEDEVVARQMPQSAYQQYKALESQVSDNELKLKNLRTLESILNSQSAAVRQMRAVTNPSSFVNVDSLRLQMDYQRTELQKINTSIDKAQSEMRVLQNKIRDDKATMENLLRRHVGGPSVSSSGRDVCVTIYSDRNEPNAKINYSYKLQGHSACNYSYDVYLDENTKKAVFVLKAEVNQFSGENWCNTPIVFSTIDAGTAGFDAALNPFYLDFYAPVVQRSNAYKSKALYANTIVRAEMDANAEEEVFLADELPMATMQNLTLMREYALATPQTISWADGSQTFILHRDTTDASFARYATPKNEEKVHFTALLPKWEDLGLLDVKCNVYMGSRFVSTSQVLTSGVGDTMRFAVGEDRNVLVQRRFQRTSPSSNGLLGKETELTCTVTITLKNTKNEAVVVNLKDQVPLSSNPEIKVTPNVADAIFDAASGVARWQVSLQPLQQKTISFSYTVRCPKDKVSQLLMLLN